MFSRTSGFCLRRALPTLFLAALFSLAGCGYQSEGLYPTGIDTISVPMWNNHSYYRDLEFQLTEAIDKNIESRTPYRLASEDEADTELTGTITGVQQNVLSYNFETNLPQETQVTIVVDFTWRDLRSGKIILQRASFARSSTYIPSIASQLPDAENEAIDNLARAIVMEMANDQF
ncbi:MAG TPA: LptE family protein [Phycisphaerae bacterium]|nr:LptE family protein [Phycisphaerae bacterium]